MDVEVFDVFDLTPYTFYRIGRGKVRGNTILESYEASGVFKLRKDIVVNENSENIESNSSLHIRSTESFLEEISNNCVGHGVLCDGKTYEVIGQTGGKNYHNGVMEHYTLTLQEAKFVEDES